MGLETSYLAMAEDYLTAGNREKARQCLDQARRFPRAKEHKEWIKRLVGRIEPAEKKRTGG